MSQETSTETVAATDQTASSGQAETSATDAQQSPPTEPKQDPRSPEAMALDLVRARRQADIASKKLKEIEGQSNDLRQRMSDYETRIKALDQASESWKSGKFSNALREAFGISRLPDEFMVEVATSETPSEPMSTEQIREQIRKEIQSENEAAESRRKEEEDARQREMMENRNEAIRQVGSIFTEHRAKWPVSWELGITSLHIGNKIDEMIQKDPNVTQEMVCLEIEKDTVARLARAGYVKSNKAAPAASPLSSTTPADRLKSDDTPPESFKERAEWKKRKNQEWHDRTFKKS